MDTSGLIPAFAAILGSTVGGLTTFATTFLTQRYNARRDMREKDLANRVNTMRQVRTFHRIVAVKKSVFLRWSDSNTLFGG